MSCRRYLSILGDASGSRAGERNIMRYYFATMLK